MTIGVYKSTVSAWVLKETINEYRICLFQRPSPWRSRHQLFVHPDIPYTSHNSAMCFQAEIEDGYYNEFIQSAAKFLRDNSAATADPGLCVVETQSLHPTHALLLTEFGVQAKKQIVTKTEAYLLAEKLNIHLSEHGGTGIGVIGALAGAGLRLSGNDGRFKGKIRLSQTVENISVEQLRAQTIIEVVKSLNGKTLADTELIKVNDHLKAVLKDNTCVLLVSPFGNNPEESVHWTPCSKQQLRNY